MPEEPEKTTPPSFNWRPFALMAALFFLVYMVFQSGGFLRTPAHEISYSAFKEQIEADNVKEVTLRGREVEGTLLKAPASAPSTSQGTHFRSRVPDFGDETLLPALEKHGVTVTVGEEPGRSGWAVLLMGLLPWLLMILLFYWLMQRAARGLGGRFGGPWRKCR